MTIDKYTPADIPAMITIWNEVVQAGQAFPQESPETLESAEKFFAEQSFCGVCRDKGDILGLYILHPNNIGRCGHICNASYAVAASARGSGIGEAMVKDCIAQARKLGFHILQFNAVTADNVPANKLYRKLGFHLLGTIPGGFRRPGGEYVPINLYYYLLDPNRTTQ